MVWVSFLEWEIQKSHLEDLKTKPVLSYLRFQVLGTCDQTSAEKYRWLDRYLKKKIFLLISTYNWAKMAFGSFLGSSKWWYKVKYIIPKVLSALIESQNLKWIIINKVNLLEESHRNCYKISGCCQLYEVHTFHGVNPSPSPILRGTWKF